MKIGIVVSMSLDLNWDFLSKALGLGQSKSPFSLEILRTFVSMINLKYQKSYIFETFQGN